MSDDNVCDDRTLMTALAELPWWPELVRAGHVPSLPAITPEHGMDGSDRDGWVRRSPSPSIRRSQPPHRVLLLAAAAVASLLLVPASGLLGRQGTASAAAADVLDRAASVVAGSDPVARPDQYWRVITDATSLSITGDPATPSTYLVRNRRTEYVSVDGRRPTVVVDARSTVDRQLAGPAGADRPTGGGGPRAWTTDLPPTAVPGSWQQPNPRFLAELPRDVDALRDRLYDDTQGHGRSEDGEVLVYVADLLRSGTVPPDLRIALYRVLRTVPGLEVTAARADLGGNRSEGVALGRFESVNGERQEIVIDPTTGEFLGERDVLERAWDGIPAGTQVRSTSVTRMAVNALPREVTARLVHEKCQVEGDGVLCRSPDE